MARLEWGTHSPFHHRVGEVSIGQTLQAAEAPVPGSIVNRTEPKRRATEDAGDVLDHGVRLGLIVYGFTHLMIAALALPLAWGDRTSGNASQRGAFTQIAQEPLGDALLIVVALGLAWLAVWQGLEAAIGHRDDDGVQLWLKRVGSAGRVVVYSALAWTAVSKALGAPKSGSGGSTDSFTARLMSAPGGRFIVGALGLAVVGVGVGLIIYGVSRRFTSRLDRGATHQDRRGPIVTLGVVGFASKGVALGVIGVLFLVAAWQHQPKESGGLDVALRELLRQPFGSYLLAAVALGFGAFGVYCFFWARHLDR